MDGGGMRGLCSNYFMQQFVSAAQINPNRIDQSFDIIGGTSIGGISSLAYAYGKSPSDMISFFINYGPQIFSSSSGLGGRASKAWKVSVMALGGQTYLGITYPKTFYYNTVLLQKLNSIFKDDRLGSFKTNILIPSWEYNSETPYLFSNVTLPSLTGQSFKIADVAAATSAAPLYFPPIQIEGAKEGSSFIDGGVYQNNTAVLCLALASVLYPDADKICLLSVGTGLGELGFDSEPDSIEERDKVMVSNHLRASGWSEVAIEALFKKVKDDPLPDETSNMEKLMDLIDIGIAGPQEAVHKQIEWQSYYGGIQGNNRLFYYRFQPQFDPKADTELDNTSAQFMEYMKQMASDTYNKDQFKISAFLQNLY
jgi:predicted acylesterase/phospholipase RssA